MNTVYFMNEGYFDKRAMMTFGLNVKESENPIGMFGTGFKYAVAIILRIGGSVQIGTKTEEGICEIITFTVVNEIIRGKEFGMVKINGEDAGFTTHLGIQWDPWMAFRELYTNCLDEGGEIVDQISGDYQTVIKVDCQAIYDAWFNKSDYFIQGKPDYATAAVEVFRERRPFFYYRGIAVADMRDEALFSYNILSQVQLTEDRTAKYMHEIIGPIETCYQTMTDVELLEPVLGCKEHFEANLRYSDWMEPSKEFIQVAEHLKKTDRGVNDSARKVVAIHTQRRGDYLGLPLAPNYQQMLEKAKVFLKGLHITIDDFEILPSQGMGDGIMGRALKGKIYISELAFQMGTKQVASTLLEEWCHLKHNCDDLSRKMQNWLFDKILSIGEEINGEPL